MRVSDGVDETRRDKIRSGAQRRTEKNGQEGPGENVTEAK
jgi:hypothetical protein